VDEAFLEGREALGLGGYFARVSFVLWDMRHGIPLGGYSALRITFLGVAARIPRPLRRPCAVDAGPPHEVGA
jgi:hypothetical protein